MIDERRQVYAVVGSEPHEGELLHAVFGTQDDADAFVTSIKAHDEARPKYPSISRAIVSTGTRTIDLISDDDRGRLDDYDKDQEAWVQASPTVFADNGKPHVSFRDQLFVVPHIVR